MSQELSPSYYAVIPANVRYAKIPPNAKLLYGEITALCNDKGYCWATNKYFAELYDKTESTISVWVSALENSDFISVVIEDYNTRKIYLKGAIQEGGVLEKSKGGIRKIERGVLEKSKEQNNTFNTTSINKDSNFENKEPNAPHAPHANGTINNLLRSGKVTFANQLETRTDPNDPREGEWRGKVEKRSPRRSNGSVGASRAIIYPFKSEDFLKTWQMWKKYKSEEHRFKFKSALSEQLSLDKLAKLSKGSESNAKEIIMESISNGWSGFFELKNEKPSTISTYKPKKAHYR